MAPRLRGEPIGADSSELRAGGGRDNGAETWAVVASLIETCKLVAVDPQAYLADVLTKIANGHLNSRVDDLLPWAFRPATASSPVV